MAESSLLPLALLYTRGTSSIEGATRFQKLVFLAQHETDADEAFAFHAERYGPFSYQLADVLETLRDRGIVDRNTRLNEAGNEKHIYTLTDYGVRVAQEMVDSPEYDALFEHATTIKTKFNNDPLNELLRYIYTKYPEYRTETELDLDRLFDPQADSQFLEPDPDTEYVGPGPAQSLDANYAADDVF